MKKKPPSKRRWRWRRRILLGLACLVVAVVALHRPAIRHILLPKILGGASAALGLNVTLEDFSLDLRGQVILIGLQGSGPSPSTGIRSFSAEKISLAVSPWRLVKGGRWLEKVSIESPRVSLDLKREPLLPGSAEGPAEGRRAFSRESLPALEIAGGAIELLNGDKVLLLDGLRSVGELPSFQVRLAQAGGSWKVPRPEALELPLEIRGRVAMREGGASLVLEDVHLAGRRMATGVEISFGQGGLVEFAGDLPGWGVKILAAKVAADTLDLQATLRDARVESIAALFTDWPAPQAGASGTLRFAIPLHAEEDFRVDGDLELSRVVWRDVGLEASVVRARILRADDLAVKGDVLAVDLKFPGRSSTDSSASMLPGVDLMGRFSRDPPAAGEAWIHVEDVVLSLGEALVDLGGRVREKNLRLEDVNVSLRRVPLEALAAVLPGIEELRGNLRGDVFLRGDPRDIAQLDASGFLAADGLEIPGLEEPAGAVLDASLSDGRVSITDGRLETCDGHLAFACGANLEVPAALEFDRIDGALFGEPFQAREPPLVEVGGGTLVVSPGKWDALGGEVDLGLAWNVGESPAGFLRAQGLRAASWTRRVIPSLAPQGVLSVEAALRGGDSASRAPGWLEARVLVEDGSVKAGTTRVSDLRLEASLEMDGERLAVPSLVLRRGRDELSVHGDFPSPLGLVAGLPGPSRLDARFTARVASVAELPLGLEGLRDLDGEVRAEGSLGGTWRGDPALFFSSLRLDAEAEVAGGRLRLLGDFPPISDVRGRLRLEGDSIAVRRLEGKVRDSSFQVQGKAEVSLPWQDGGARLKGADLELRAKDALLVRTPDLRVRGDLDLRLSGTWEKPALAGEVKIIRAYYLKDVVLTASVRGPRRPFQLFAIKEPPFDSMSFDIKLKADRTITIKNNLVSTRATADLRLGGKGSEPLLTGTISTDEGDARFANATLKVRNSLVEFLPADPLNPKLQIALGEKIRGYIVNLFIGGTLEEPEIILDSSPPLEREKLLVLITTGLTLDEIEQRGVDRVAATQAALYFGRGLLRHFSRGDPTETSFFDRFSLEVESARSAKYEDPLRGEYRIVEGVLFPEDEVLLQGERDTYGDYNFNVGMRFELD